MLPALDIFYTILHLVLIIFNLVGWSWKPLRKAHLVTILSTAASWFLLGIWFGIGYCPITDWHWRVKRRLGEFDLPGSFIKYFADKCTGMDISASLVDTITVASFFAALGMSVYVNFLRRGVQKNGTE